MIIIISTWWCELVTLVRNFSGRIHTLPILIIFISIVVFVNYLLLSFFNSKEQTVIHEFVFFEQFQVVFNLFFYLNYVNLWELQKWLVFVHVFLFNPLQILIFECTSILEFISPLNVTVNHRAFEIKNIEKVFWIVTSDSVCHEKKLHWYNVFHLYFKNSIDSSYQTLSIFFNML